MRAPIQLTPLRTPPLKEQVIRELVRLVNEGALEPGDRLPTERELSEQLAVSRSTVREAVQFLQALGLVEIRHGSGTFIGVSPKGPDELRGEWRRWTRRHADRVRELLEVRQGVESFAAELAAVRADDASAELATMAEALEQMEAAGEQGDVPALVQADMLFHRALCGAAGNGAMVELADLLSKELVRERAASFDIPGRPKRSRREHREIYEAVRAGEPARARTAVLEHLRSVERDIARSVLASNERGDAKR